VEGDPSDGLGEHLDPGGAGDKESQSQPQDVPGDIVVDNNAHCDKKVENDEAMKRTWTGASYFDKKSSC
jgi:hypothetical protein